MYPFEVQCFVLWGKTKKFKRTVWRPVSVLCLVQIQLCYVEGCRDYGLTFPLLLQITWAFSDLFFINSLAKKILKDANWGIGTYRQTTHKEMAWQLQGRGRQWENLNKQEVQELPTASGIGKYKGDRLCRIRIRTKYGFRASCTRSGCEIRNTDDTHASGLWIPPKEKNEHKIAMQETCDKKIA